MKSLKVDLRDRFDAWHARMDNDPALIRKGEGYADFHTATMFGAFCAGYRARMDEEAGIALGW
jgi:hypothetical protein